MSLLTCETIASLIPPDTRRIVVAYSGGVDSHVLLHLCAQHDAIKSRLQAVYIDHALQAPSAQWGEHCRQQAAMLGIACRVLPVKAQAAPGESPEAAARAARYQALAGVLEQGDVLLLAQHREDQMETFLLQLLRGSGLAGLSAMPVSAPLGIGSMVRPLLEVGKDAILRYAQQHNLQWVDDPSNQSDDYDRNFLRHHIVPALRQRWPGLDKTVARSAKHCQQAWAQLQSLLPTAALQAATLSLSDLQQADPAMRLQMVRAWLTQRGLRPPSQAQLLQIQRQFVEQEPTSQARIMLQQRVIRAYRGILYCLPLHHQQPAANQPWPTDQTRLQASNGYCLQLKRGRQGIPCALWHNAQVSIQPRSGGESLHLSGRQGHHRLKNLYQEAGIPPWVRQALPLLYINGRLAAIPGLWIASWAWQATGDCYAVDVLEATLNSAGGDVCSNGS